MPGVIDDDIVGVCQAGPRGGGRQRLPGVRGGGTQAHLQPTHHPYLY